VKSFFIENETFANCKLKHLPILQCVKSSGLSRIKFTDTTQFLGSSLQPAR